MRKIFFASLAMLSGFLNAQSFQGMAVYESKTSTSDMTSNFRGNREITPEMQNATSTSSEGLVEEISPVPGGGVMIDLKGRFQSPLIITQDPAGKQKNRHLNDLPLYTPQHPTNKNTEGSGHEQK